ncbi:MAG: SPOR domain-containing protein [Treponema sp.]|nr:SPOR domain-containing protein [Treponema sp.]
MEKRKLLLVAVSVGVFLVIVLSAAILIFTPSGGGAVIARSAPVEKPASGTPPRLPASADAAEMVRNTGDLQGLKVPPPALPGSPNSPADGDNASDTSASASAVQENNFYFNDENPVRSPPARTPVVERDEGGSAQVVINVPKPSAPGVPASSPRSPAPVQPAQTKTGQSGQGARAAPAVNPAPAAGTPVSVTAASGAQAVPRTGTTGTASAAAKPSAAPAARTPANPSRPRTRPQQDYWIQTGAFSALVRAEDAKEILASKGLVSIIDDREVNGQIWYRVRVGPYTSENEANYWLALVKAINGFDQSQVRSSQR